MAKKALLDVLEQTIGKYVKNLDAESLNVAVWSGRVALNNLELDVEAVNAELDRQAAEAPNLALPLKVISGRFRSFEVDVPWASLTSRSVILRAQGLDVNVEAHDRLAQTDLMHIAVDNEEQRATRIREAREQSIELSEKYRQQTYTMRKLAMQDGSDESTSASQQKSTFSSRLVRRIMENIQIEINNVHVSLRDSSGSLGVVLESLALVTTDKDGKQVFVDRTSSENSAEKAFLHKKLLIKGLGIYVDDEENIGVSSTMKTTLSSINEANIATTLIDSPAVPHSYVLAPLTFQASLRQADGTNFVDCAKYQLMSELSSMSFILSRQQLDLTRKISFDVSSSGSAVACPLFPEYRPLTRITSGRAARQWWRYSVRAIGRLNGRRSWAEFFLAFQKRRTYIPLFKRHAYSTSSPWLKPLQPSEMETLISLEQDRTISVEGLMTWRSIAEGQMEMEREKHHAKRNESTSSSKTSYFSSIFGTSRSSSHAPNISVESPTDEAPIQLTDDEVRELDKMSKEDFMDPELSRDSKLCDVEFILKSMRISLISFDKRYLTSLEMGAVGLRFEAGANGSFQCNFDLTDIEIHDKTTPKTLFPSVLKSLESQPTDSQYPAFHLSFCKAATGDQSLLVKLAAFEAVASQILFKELRAFFSAVPNTLDHSKTRHNPVLAQSMSGSVDLFYDANQGASVFVDEERELQNGLLESGRHYFKEANQNKSDFSTVLVQAWKEKAANRVAWKIDVDIDAPVLVIPEKCNDSTANILVLDLGRFKLKYGKFKPAASVERWFEENCCEIDADLALDSGSISIDNLTFMVGNVSDRRLLCGNVDASGKVNAIIDPISVSLDFGVDSSSATVDAARACCIGIIPTISSQMSLSQGAAIFVVVGAWSDFIDTQRGKSYDFGKTAIPSNGSKGDSKYSPDGNDIEYTVHTAYETPPKLNPTNDQGERMFFSIGLQRLSMILSLDSESRVEAHLVSVYSSARNMMDGSSVVSLRMGWFWILDMLEHSKVRRQRLLAHSKLPRSPEAFAMENTYDILEELASQGVFNHNYSGSTDLADISWHSHPVIEPVEDKDSVVGHVLDARFSSLFVHWNPSAIKAVTEVLENLSCLTNQHDGNSTIILSPEKTSRALKFKSAPDELGRTRPGRITFNLRMERLELTLNSALDDLPLFVLTVSDTRINVSSSEQAIETFIALGDISVKMNESLGDTLPKYRTLLGLSPGQQRSLLTMRYFEGQHALQNTNVPMKGSLDVGELRTYADIHLSPMRLCFIQSQVMALVDYCSEGILGTITASAADSAAKAAIEIVEMADGAKLFQIGASSFDFVLPEAASVTNQMTIHAGKLDATYVLLPGLEPTTATLELSEVSLLGSQNDMMEEERIRMLINVVLPSDEVGSLDDQAMRVDIKMPSASFRVANHQYTQILRTLDTNIGELRLHLRDESDTTSGPLGQQGTLDPNETKEMTHTGSHIIEKQRRMYLKLDVGVLAMELFDSSMSPLLRIAAVNTFVDYQTHPHEEASFCKVSLRNLVCEDIRHRALNRQYRHLISQSGTASSEDLAVGDLFHVEYESRKNESILDLMVGCPQVVLIPDAMSEVLSFFQREDSAYGADDGMVSSSSHDDRQLNELPMPGVDTTAKAEHSNSFSSRLSVKTRTCRIVLVDLGGNLSGGSERAEQLAETLVLQGVFQTNVQSVSDVESSKILGSDFSCNAESMEIFSAFGSTMKSPLQILEPSEASAHGSMKVDANGTNEIEIRAATMTSFDFTFSMHNAALLSAIINSLKCSFDAPNEVKDGVVPLTRVEAEHIEMLAIELESPSHDKALASQPSSISLGDSENISNRHTIGESLFGSTRIQVKITMPKSMITVVNDLQGLDEALFRVSVANFVTGGELFLASPAMTTFDAHVNTSILADYFDTSCNIWNKLLIQPWEVTIRAMRGASRRFESKRLSTSIDLESFPCCISFSEQFLVSLASASKMWTIYSVATNISSNEENERETGSVRASLAATAARNLVTSLPYAIENCSGMDIDFSLPGESTNDSCCKHGKTVYFRFEPPKGRGYGGRRTYGQDVDFQKSIAMTLEGDSSVVVGHLDSEFGLPRKAHQLRSGKTIITEVLKKGKTTVLLVTSQIRITNNTSLAFHVSVLEEASRAHVGVCAAKMGDRGSSTKLTVSDCGTATRDSTTFSVPAEWMLPFSNGWDEKGQSKLCLEIAPDIDTAREIKLSGKIDILATLQEMKASTNGRAISKFDVSCAPVEGRTIETSSFVTQVLLEMELTPEMRLFIMVTLEPRAVIENRFPVSIGVRTPMPYTFSLSPQERLPRKDIVYRLSRGKRIEVFTSGPSIAISISTAETPIAGMDLDWLDTSWIDLPLVSEFSLLEPVKCYLPFRGQDSDNASAAGVNGSELFVVEGTESLSDLILPSDDSKRSARSRDFPSTRVEKDPGEPQRTFFITVACYAVDHTGTLLFQQLHNSSRRRSSISEIDLLVNATSDNATVPRRSGKRTSASMPYCPFPAFAWLYNQRRVTMLPTGNVPIQLLQMTMDSEVGLRRSLPFLVEELPIGQGGAGTIPVLWENKQASGLYAYRTFVNEHQCEIHVVPEFLVFNGSAHLVMVKEREQPELLVEGGKVSRLEVHSRLSGLELALYFVELECYSSFLRVDKLGMKVAALKTNEGVLVGSVCIQTVIDTRGDARLVVKIGEVSSTGTASKSTNSRSNIFARDLFRFRVRWTELQLVLNELQTPAASGWSIKKAVARIQQSPKTRQRPNLSSHEQASRIGTSPASQNLGHETPTSKIKMFHSTDGLAGQGDSRITEILQQPVATIIFSRFTFDVQRVFKDDATTAALSSERCQISVIVHRVTVKDLTPDSPFPVVLDCSGDTSFLDLCIRIKGPMTAEIVRVDLFDLNLAHSKGQSESIKLTTSEDYVWRILDLINRIMAATSDFAGYALRLEEDNTHGGFIVRIDDTTSITSEHQSGDYAPPIGDTLFDINVARVSPFSLLVSFKRNPQLRRYRKARSSERGSALMNYFSHRLKFTIDRAELNFARYEDRSLKGPPDRLFENLFAVYTSRMKFKLVTLLTSASLQDWKFLAARDSGEDDYVEGDILRATGNLTGKASHLLLKRTSNLLGDGVSDLSRALGDTIESTSGKIGVRRVGAGLNSVVSGVGDGVGSAVSGVGTGTGKILKGAGQGIGHAIGGVAGGAMQIGKGIGKGIKKRDGQAVVQGLSEGMSSVGGGIAQGAESAVVGAADGLLLAGRGLFSGVKSVGKGIGGAFTGKKLAKKNSRR